METRGGRRRRGGREGDGEGGIDLPGPWIVVDKVTVTVVNPLSIVLLWRGLLSSTNMRPGQYQHYVKDHTCSVMRVDWFRI